MALLGTRGLQLLHSAHLYFLLHAKLYPAYSPSDCGLNGNDLLPWRHQHLTFSGPYSRSSSSCYWALSSWSASLASQRCSPTSPPTQPSMVWLAGHSEWLPSYSELLLPQHRAHVFNCVALDQSWPSRARSEGCPVPFLKVLSSALWNFSHELDWQQLANHWNCGCSKDARLHCLKRYFAAWLAF